MDTTALLVEALKALDDADVPEDLRPVAFECAFGHLAGGSSAAVRVTGEPIAAARGFAADGDEIQQIASRLGLSPELIADVFDFSGDDPEIVIATSKLDREKAAASKQLALLVTAARQAIGKEDWTSAGVIRDVCRDYGKLDSANFATTLLSMGSIFNFRGKGQQREVKLTRHGYERAATLVQELTE